MDMRKKKALNMSGLNKSAISALRIADFIAVFLRALGNWPFQYDRIGRKVPESWPFSENRQFNYNKPSKSAMPIAEFIAEKIR